MWMLLTAASVVGFAAYKLFYPSAPSAAPGAVAGPKSVTSPAGPIAVGDFIAVDGGQMGGPGMPQAVPPDVAAVLANLSQARMQVTTLSTPSPNSIGAAFADSRIPPFPGSLVVPLSAVIAKLT